ncbi:hypothetical protein [Radicibacter daui]|uniref:hypothetical protein n=1 Tax=Radicibacter daui TaxID=3064829 RepID=UPI004046AABF
MGNAAAAPQPVVRSPAPALALAVAVLIYALIADPVPQAPGGPELAMAAALLMATGISRPLGLVTGTLWNDGRWQGPSVVAFFILLLAPSAVALAHGREGGEALRDIVPLCFAFLPLFVAGRLGPRAAGWLAPLLAAAGAALALRYMAGWGMLLAGTGATIPLTLGALVPLVPFAGIWAFGRLMDREAVPPLLWLLLPGVVLAVNAALLFSGQRAGLALVLAAEVLLWLGGLRRRPLRALLLALLFGACLLPAAGLIEAPASALLRKWLEAGSNNRIAEWHAVLATLDTVAAGPLAGAGWGAVFNNPAADWQQVGFVHSASGYMLLKGGVIALAAFALYLAALVRQGAVLLRRQPALALAIAVPVLLSVTLYTGFKTLGFGLVLLLLVEASDGKTISPSWRERRLFAQLQPAFPLPGAVMTLAAPPLPVSPDAADPLRWLAARWRAALGLTLGLWLLAGFTWLLVPGQKTARMVVAPAERELLPETQPGRSLPSLLGSIGLGLAQNPAPNFQTWRHLLSSPTVVADLPPELAAPLFSSRADYERVAKDPVAIARQLKRRLEIHPVADAPFYEVILRHEDSAYAITLMQRLSRLADDAVRGAEAARLKGEVEFLQRKLALEQTSRTLDMLGGLLQREEQRLLLLEAGEQFALQVIEPARAPLKPDWPDPWWVLAIVALGGPMLALTGLAGVQKLQALRWGPA